MLATRTVVIFVVAVVAVAACGGSPPAAPRTPATSPTATSTAATPEPSATERAACGPKHGVEVDSLACLVAERKRLEAGDAAGAKALLVYGCDHGDVDACQDLRALEPARAAELDGKITAACGALGDDGKRLAACLRGHTTDVIAPKEVGAKLPVALALDLRARYGPELLEVSDAAAGACKTATGSATTASLEGSSVARDAAFLDAAILCDGGFDLAKASDASRSGETSNSNFTVRTLHDGHLADEQTVRLDAPTGHGRVGVYCPSLLVEDDHAADVWTRDESDGITTTVIATVRIDQPCRTTAVLAERANDAAAVHAALAPVAPVVGDALDKLAAACDAGPAGLDTRKSPLAGHAIERTARVLSFEPHCSFGYRGFTFASTKPLRHPNPMSSSHEFLRVDGQAVRAEAIQGLADRFELTLRRRDAELVVGVHR